jgi:hypothetical protein
MDDELKWKKRFAISMLVRLASLMVFFLGVAIAYSDLLRPGGWPQVGAIVALIGAIDALFAPKLLRHHWRKQDGEI